MRTRLGECLVRAGLITPDELRRAVAEQERTGERLGVVVARLHLASEEQIADALASQLGFRYVDLREEPPDPEAALLIEPEFAARAACIGIRLDRNVLTLAMADPLVFSLVPDLEARTGRRIEPVVATRSGILKALEMLHSDSTKNAEDAKDAEDAKGTEETDDVAALLDSLIEQAVEREADEIHLDPAADRLRVRFRVEGVLVDVMSLPRAVHDELVARIKVMAALDVAERLLPQSGRLHAADAHFQATTLRTIHGERLVLRRLERRRAPAALETLGLMAAPLAEVRRWLAQRRGLIVVAGPRGSGRTTTLHAMLASLNGDELDAVTIEDPIELELPNAIQAEVDRLVGSTINAALESALRHRPDVVLVDELASASTATGVAAAAAEGHLILTAVTADDAATGALKVAQLAGAQLASSVLIGVVAQRLVRRLCDTCRVARAPLPVERRAMSLPDLEAEGVQLFGPAGCDACDHTGYRGRTGIFEVMTIDEPLKRLIADGASRAELHAAALSGGMTTIAEHGLASVRDGVTTMGEVERVLGVVGEPRWLCPACGSPVGADFAACARCGVRLDRSCERCGRALQPRWNFCPYCAEGTDAPGSHRKRGIIGLVRNPDAPGLV